MEHMLTENQIRRDFTQSLIKTVVTDTLSLLPSTLGPLDQSDRDLIDQLCASGSKTSMFNSNILSLSVETLMTYIPHETSLKDANSADLFDAALAEDAQTGTVVRTLSYKYAQTLTSALNTMRQSVIEEAQRAVDHIEERVAQQTIAAQEATDALEMFNWGVLNDEQVLFHVITTCRDDAELVIKSDGSSNNDQFVNMCFGRQYKFAYELLPQNVVGSIESLLDQSATSEKSATTLKAWLSYKDRFTDYISGIKDLVTAKNAAKMVAGVESLSDAYVTTMNFKRSIGSASDSRDINDAVRLATDNILTSLSMSLGAVQVLRDNYKQTLVLSAEALENSTKVCINSDAFTPVQETVNGKDIITYFKHMQHNSEPFPKLGLSTTRVVNSMNSALEWFTTQSSAEKLDQHLNDKVDIRRIARQELQSWTANHMSVDSPVHLPETVKSNIDYCTRLIANSTEPMLDIVTDYIVKFHNNAPLTKLYNYTTESLKTEMPIDAATRTASIKWLVELNNNISVAS